MRSRLLACAASLVLSGWANNAPQPSLPELPPGSIQPSISQPVLDMTVEGVLPQHFCGIHSSLGAPAGDVGKLQLEG